MAEVAAPAQVAAPAEVAAEVLVEAQGEAVPTAGRAKPGAPAEAEVVVEVAEDVRASCRFAASANVVPARGNCQQSGIADPQDPVFRLIIGL